jgi:hypothetical protein
MFLPERPLFSEPGPEDVTFYGADYGAEKVTGGSFLEAARPFISGYFTTTLMAMVASSVRGV